jgi:hypothetical protein
MNRRQKAATLLLGAWLVLGNIVPLLNIGLPRESAIIALLGVAAGVAVLFGWWRRRDRNKGDHASGMILLALWLILVSLKPLVGLSGQWLEIGLALLALAAGIRILID